MARVGWRGGRWLKERYLRGGRGGCKLDFPFFLYCTPSKKRRKPANTGTASQHLRTFEKMDISQDSGNFPGCIIMLTNLNKKVHYKGCNVVFIKRRNRSYVDQLSKQNPKFDVEKSEHVSNQMKFTVPPR